MTREEMAAKLNGREIREEITREESAEARQAGLVVVYGASDDLMEFDGAIYDEFGCFDGGTARVVRTGLIDESDARKYHDGDVTTIESVWCDPANDPLISWTYKTAIPHATFDIMEDGEVYCRGIIFYLIDVL